MSKCTSSSKSWSADKHYAGKAYSIRSVDALMYQDCLSYKSRVYVHKSGGALGGHAIKIIGYGVNTCNGIYLLTIWVVCQRC